MFVGGRGRRWWWSWLQSDNDGQAGASIIGSIIHTWQLRTSVGMMMVKVRLRGDEREVGWTGDEGRRSVL